MRLFHVGDLPLDQKGGDCECEQLAKCEDTDNTDGSSATVSLNSSTMWLPFLAMASFSMVL